MADTAQMRSEAVRGLGVLARRLEDRGEVSRARGRQLRMVVGMWGRALERWPEGVREISGVGEMFSPQCLSGFWDLVEAGRLRAEGVGDPLPLATLRVVRDCLALLGRAVLGDDPEWLPVVGYQQRPKDTVERGPMALAYRTLVDLGPGAPVERGGFRLRVEHRVRLLAMMTVVMDTGARSYELQDQRLDDVGAGEGTLAVRRYPQNAAHLHPVEETFVLREGTRVALRAWLEVRAALVGQREGAAPGALWVSVAPSPGQETVGFPLRARGIQRSYASGVRELNGLLAGEWGWEPVPRTLEQLRRAVGAVPVGVRLVRAPAGPATAG